jgi:hypothetical protein
MKSSNQAPQSVDLEARSAEVSQSGLLILNADDWGRDHETSERIFECAQQRTVSSVSAMVFMEDSERAAAIARDHRIDAGLHLNFTTQFSARNTPSKLLELQQEIASYLLRRRLNQVVFHPRLASSFEYVVATQLDEFRRIYGEDPGRVDGHHHMHLCANVLFAGLLPKGTVVRRNFSFQPGEKSLVNRLYRKAVDYGLARRHRLVDFLFSLPPLETQGRFERILSFARHSVVEVETHPVNAEEYRFLTAGEILRRTGDFPIAARFTVPDRGCVVTEGKRA